jgi:UrcA family protein
MSVIVNRIAAIAALALAATPIVGLASAHAAEPDQPVVRIQVGDLRLSHPADAREFQRRADRAAAQMCSERGVRGLSYRACLMDFREDLRAELSPVQIADLRAARRAEPAVFAGRDF